MALGVPAKLKLDAVEPEDDDPDGRAPVRGERRAVPRIAPTAGRLRPSTTANVPGP